MMGEERSIIPAPVLPLVTPEEAAQQWQRFESLKAKLLVDDDYQTIAGKRFIKRSGFRKIAVYFGLSDRVVKEERHDREDGSFSWRIVVEAFAPNGRTCIGVGACDSRERKFAHTEHDVYATAHTRAKSRAISDMVAGGVVSAEEAEGGQGVELTASEEEAPPPWKPTKVPLTKEAVNITGVKQFPLIGQGNKALGMVNWVEDEASIIPENPVAMDDPAVKGFLLGKVLRNMVEQKVLEYQTDTTDGFLLNVVLRGKLNDQVVKEIVSTAKWAFEKAMGR